MKHRILAFLCAATVACTSCAGALADRGFAGGTTAIATMEGVDQAGGGLFQRAGDDAYYNIEQMTATTDTVYALATTQAGPVLSYWKPGMEANVNIAKDGNGQALVYAGYYSSAEDLENAQDEAGNPIDGTHAISYLVENGEQLLAVNALTGLVFEVKIDGDKAVFTDLVTVKNTDIFYHVEDDYRYGVTMSGRAIADGKLLLTMNDWDNQGKQITALYLIDLQTGELTTSGVEHVIGVTGYKDGKALAIIYDSDNAYDEATQTIKYPSVAMYDPKTDTVQTAFDLDTYVDTVRYCEALDAIVYLDNTRIMGYLNLTEKKQLGYAPVNYASNMAVIGNAILISTWEETVVREMSTSFRTDAYLNVSGAWMDDGTKLFVSRNPNVPVYFSNNYATDVESLSQAMVSGDDSLDLVALSVGYSSIDTLMKKGYCADLSGYPELVDAVNRMQPCVRDAVMKDGKLYAVPVDFSSWGFFYNQRILQEIGLTEDDLPHNWVEMCEFVTEWNDAYADEYGEYSLFDYISSTKAQLMDWMMEDYMAWCMAKGQDVTFDTPEFRAIMEALEKVECDVVDQKASDAMKSDAYFESLFMNGYQVVGAFDWMTNTEYDYQRYLPMSLTDGTEQVIACDLNVMFINPRTKNMDEAVKLLECKLEAMTEEQKHCIYENETEPVLNPNYANMVKQEQEVVENLKAMLEKADESEKKDLEESLKWEENYLATRLPRYEYSVSAEQIAYFQENIVPKLTVRKTTFLSGTKDNSATELNDLMDRFREGQISMDQFIREADNKMRMMRLENQ